MAGAVGSTALGSHFGASLEDQGADRALRGQAEAARSAGERKAP